MARSRTSATGVRGHALSIKRALRDLGRVVLTAHVRTDGDSVGSCLAFAAILRARGFWSQVALEY